MKKILAIILSLVLAFTLVALVACVPFDTGGEVDGKVDQTDGNANQAVGGAVQSGGGIQHDADVNQSSQSNQSAQPKPDDKNEQSNNQQLPSEKDDKQEYPENKVGDFFVPVDLSNFITRMIFVNTLVATVDFEKLPYFEGKDALEVVNGFIDDVLLRYDVGVAISVTNGYAVKFTLDRQSILAILDDALTDEQESAKETVKESLAADSMLELIVRVDDEGAVILTASGIIRKTDAK